MDYPVYCGDCLEKLAAMEPASVDLVFTSPPYEAARSYGIDFNLKGQEWVDWAVERFCACLRVCRGLVAWVVEGQTRHYRWSATPALLMADLHRKGVHLRKPAAYVRDGIPGSGGKEWLKNRYEFIICATNGGRLPWSNNIAMGKPCRGKGGACTNQRRDGREKKVVPHRNRDGEVVWKRRPFLRPRIANPGNIIVCKSGGGQIGSKLAHANEAPFPEYLVEFFIRSFCPDHGVVLDPFCGSGTTLAVARTLGRGYMGIDIRQSQVDLTCRRLYDVQPPLFPL